MLSIDLLCQKANRGMDGPSVRHQLKISVLLPFLNLIAQGDQLGTHLFTDISVNALGTLLVAFGAEVWG